MTDYRPVNSKRLAGSALSALALCTVILFGLTGLSGCGTVRELIGSPATRTPPPPVQIRTPTYAPTIAQGPTTIADFVGTWSDPAAQWTVRFNADGTFGSDYQGVKDFRSGTFQVHDDRLDLIGGDGEVDSGKIVGDDVKFRLGTLKKTS